MRATNRPRLLLAVLVADVALAMGMAAAARAGRPQIEEVEESLAHDRSFKVRVEAALVLGRLRQTRSVPVLIGALKDPFPAARAAAAQALGASAHLLRATPCCAPARIGTRWSGAWRARPRKSWAATSNPGRRRRRRAVPGFRRRPGRKLSFEVKGVGDRSQRAGPALRSHMRDFLVD